MQNVTVTEQNDRDCAPQKPKSLQTEIESNVEKLAALNTRLRRGLKVTKDHEILSAAPLSASATGEDNTERLARLLQRLNTHPPRPTPHRFGQTASSIRDNSFSTASALAPLNAPEAVLLEPPSRLPSPPSPIAGAAHGGSSKIASEKGFTPLPIPRNRPQTSFYTLSQPANEGKVRQAAAKIMEKFYREHQEGNDAPTKGPDSVSTGLSTSSSFEARRASPFPTLEGSRQASTHGRGVPLSNPVIENEMPLSTSTPREQLIRLYQQYTKRWLEINQEARTRAEAESVCFAYYDPEAGKIIERYSETEITELKKWEEKIKNLRKQLPPPKTKSSLTPFLLPREGHPALLPSPGTSFAPAAVPKKMVRFSGHRPPITSDFPSDQQAVNQGAIDREPSLKP